MTLLETYSKRLAVSESVYKNAHSGEVLSDQKKLAVAMILNNTNRFMNEAFTNSVGTQRADLGSYKKFCLNLTTVALPNLIAYDLVIVHPMSSFSGYIAYVKYTTGSNKGATKQGKVLNDPFRLGDVDTNYTASAVVESVDAEATTVTPAWTPVIDNKIIGIKKDGSGEVELTLTDGSVTVEAGVYSKVKYTYDNVVIPQNDLPIINAEIANIPLVAKARMIAVYYSQIAAFQAKKDYGFDLGDQIAEKACGEVQYEIDTEITDLLVANAAVDDELTFNKKLPVGVSKAEHYEGFSEIVEIAKQKIYDKTKRFAPTYMLIASNVLPILTFIKGFKAAPTAEINGPYFAGTLNGLKVFVTPNIAVSKFVLGVNGNDMMSSAAVYAPYMAIIPTQLLGHADGAMSQGWSTLYALEMLNKDLLIAGNITSTAQVVDTKEQA